MLLFVATRGETKPSQEIWRPYLTGRLKVHRIDCAHEAMMDALPAAKIGRVLAEEIDRRAATAQTPRRRT
jgi:thioesterase domain-containing protein